jgi:hypothetical protein
VPSQCAGAILFLGLGGRYVVMGTDYDATPLRVDVRSRRLRLGIALKVTLDARTAAPVIAITAAGYLPPLGGFARPVAGAPRDPGSPGFVTNGPAPNWRHGALMKREFRRPE